jgi:hypothetical protein
MAKVENNKKSSLFTRKSELHLRRKLAKCYIWSKTLCGAETWTLRKVDLKYLKSFETWCWRRMEKISWPDRVKDEVLQSVKEDRNILHTLEGRLTGSVTSCVETAF